MSSSYCKDVHSLYRATCQDGPVTRKARDLLEYMHWFTVNAEFDPKTGYALPQALSAFLAKVSVPKPADRIQDRLYRITEHSRPALERLLQTLNESPRREHAVLPAHSVRELDAGSFIKLSMRPGRNIREKLAGKPYLQAARRFQSIDLLENRLLKTFVARLAELLKLRSDLLKEPEDYLLPLIETWLRADEVKTIGRWHNLPPNNTLLAHRDYRRVWDSWRWMQTLDDDIVLDLSRIDEYRDTMAQWMDYGRIYREGMHLFAEIPVLFDYENFKIQTWSPKPLFQQTPTKIDRSPVKKTIEPAVCLDLAEVHPQFADTTKASQTLLETYIWQQWQNDAEIIDITLFNSDAVYLHSDATTITSPDLFFNTDDSEEHYKCLDRAARPFTSRLRDMFKNDKLIWLIPDALNDFEVEIIRRNLNARFPDAEPLPRSIAAIFEQIDYADIKGNGYSVLVVDTVGGITSATKMIAKLDPKLKKRLPETNGYYWERCPPVILSKTNTEEKQYYNIATLDADENWNKAVLPELSQSPKVEQLKADPRIGKCDSYIKISNSPVTGGSRFHALQARAGDIPLWRDHIPELSIKVMQDGRYKRFSLVARGTTVEPIRGQAVRIPIAKRFTLPAKKLHYQLPLFQGENDEELRYSARLESPAFPLQTNTECELILTFRYGDDDPYTLMFNPLDNIFPPVQAKWRRTVEEIITDAPAPDYPKPKTWDELRRMPKPDSDEASDLLEWVVSAIDKLDRDLFTRPKARKTGALCSEWLVDRNGKHFNRAECMEASASVFIHENSFLQGIDFGSFQKGAELSFELRQCNGRYYGHKVAHRDYCEKAQWRHCDDNRADEIAYSIRRRLYVPIIHVWKDGRSIRDRRCPQEFAEAATEIIKYLADLINQEELHETIQGELLFLLSCLHEDTPDECIEWITEQAESGDICDPQAVGFALGNLSKKWQQHVFDCLVTNPRNDIINVFAYAIWRERQFVEYFSLSTLQALLDVLLERVENVLLVQTGISKNDYKQVLRQWVRATAEPLELLLGLLRTRDSSDPDIKMLLQPHQKITKQFAEQIDRIDDLIAKKHIVLFSRVQIDVKKPQGVRTPDLLYVLRLYLTGDDGANAIHIAGVSDTDD